jgi:F0F1-type ATP synthase delta subunit
VQKQTGAKEVVLQTEENTEIVGGLVIRFEDKIFDTSIQTQIQKLKKELNIA